MLAKEVTRLTKRRILIPRCLGAEDGEESRAIKDERLESRRVFKVKLWLVVWNYRALPAEGLETLL